MKRRFAISRLDEARIVAMLRAVSPTARGALRKRLLGEPRARDEAATELLRHRTPQADTLAEFLDFTTLNDDARRMALRALGRLEGED